MLNGRRLMRAVDIASIISALRGVGVDANYLFMVDSAEIYEGQKKLQKEVSTVLIDMADFIVNPNNKDMYNKDLNTLNALIDSSISEAYNNINNNY